MVLSFSYLLFLLAGIGAMLLIDYRYKLAVFYRLRPTLLTVGCGVILFSIWDVIGISAGVFFIGQTEVLSGIKLGPNFPLEELFFLTFLCYFSLILYRFMEKKWPRI